MEAQSGGKIFPPDHTFAASETDISVKVGYWSTCGWEGAVCGTLLITPLPLERFGESQQL